ncbi:MAG: hypothetical protein WBL67_20150 [Nitrososphaeraceae archaeon]
MTRDLIDVLIRRRIGERVELSRVCIPNVLTGTNNNAHNATPTINPVIIP